MLIVAMHDDGPFAAEILLQKANGELSQFLEIICLQHV